MALISISIDPTPIAIVVITMILNLVVVVYDVIFVSKPITLFPQPRCFWLNPYTLIKFQIIARLQDDPVLITSILILNLKFLILISKLVYFWFRFIFLVFTNHLGLFLVLFFALILDRLTTRFYDLIHLLFIVVCLLTHLTLSSANQILDLIFHSLL